MTDNWYVDTETCGRHGVPVLIQYAINDGPINLFDIWTNPIEQTLELIERMCAANFIGFNIAFDWFHLTKIYTMFKLLHDEVGNHEFPEDHIDRLGHIEEQARFADICLRPAGALDIMLAARRGKYQALMPRDPIRIRRVPSVLARSLAEELEKRLALDPIYFEKSKEKQAKWKIYDRKNWRDGSIDPDFKDVVLRFRSSGALKSLAKHALGINTSRLLLFKDIEPDKSLYPQEYGYAPYALAVTPEGAPWVRRGKWGQKKNAYIRSWPAVIKEFILHWGYNQRARTYGVDDVDYTRRLHLEHFAHVQPGDRDSELACMVASVRWSGFAYDQAALEQLHADTLKSIAKVPSAPHKVKQYLLEVMDENGPITFQKGTKKTILEEISLDPKNRWSDECLDCNGGDPDCVYCAGTGFVKSQVMMRAGEVLAARKAGNRKNTIEKLLRAKRLHADFKVGGTLSNRMAGTGGVNATGLDRTKEFRTCFVFVDTNLRHLFVYSGGDYDSFEVALAAAVFQDPKLTSDLKADFKIHALMGARLSGLTYDEVNKTKGSKIKDWYSIGKSGVFLIFYGGNEETFKQKLGIPIEIGKAATDYFLNHYRGIKRFGDEINKRFGALTQPGGISTKVYWTDPEDYIESFLGFRRFFTLENAIRKELYDLAQNVPNAWKLLPVRVKRNDKIQSAGGAVASALYGACFGLSQAVVRQAKNHAIQSPGAEITKETQFAVWSHQPKGISVWIVKPMNVHDELNTVVRRGHEVAVKATVDATIAKYRDKVPLIAMEWKLSINNWSEK